MCLDVLGVAGDDGSAASSSGRGGQNLPRSRHPYGDGHRRLWPHRRVGCAACGMLTTPSPRILTGAELDEMDEAALQLC